MGRSDSFKAGSGAVSELNEQTMLPYAASLYSVWAGERVEHAAQDPIKTESPGTKGNRGMSVSIIPGGSWLAGLDREIIRCINCGLIQYRTRRGNCRRCLHLLPHQSKPILTPAPPRNGTEVEAAHSQNSVIVENIGQRIRGLRESLGVKQNELMVRSHVSRSYLCRLEGGAMLPSLYTLEKMAEALGVGLNRFFIPASRGEVLLEDPFIRELHSYLRQLDRQAWESIRVRLAAISAAE